ncbi:uncharacterized protein LOC110858763 isoform X1 [Folsomia candida]|uniref:uncharacterized protein LOC110858763 isoform X1 n=1 Tax=Folsomia candida TaxID=158441 RepID=UPI001604AF36|nr:uncharacterized protein LOC110858763 isoform X1 [Folsomia candida]XP_035714763.1 uncharacterized protein LOC110858763 isoform X1 [Folsomia candida]XP_035714764.1 uncharacterized protein LOC110858763 isoform X1 [Folsomia candida]XP_035714765.1 uncharacterized protein LOC110858763 isoform X1 [Folsomia candida]
MSETESKFINDAISELVISSAIKISEEEAGQFISPVFTVAKSDGGRRFVLNLKKLNTFIFAPHFKLEDIRMAKQLVSPGCYMTVIDQKDAYYMIPIALESQKYLKFRWNGVLYAYTCLCFGLNLAPWLFTKIMKPVLAYLRSRGFQNVSYLDDLLTIGRTLEACLVNLQFTIKLFEELGIRINFKKSQLIPSREVKFLGFVICSIDMNLTLPISKKNNLVQKIIKYLSSNCNTIHKLAEIIGILISVCPAVKYGQLYTRQLEIEKTLALENSNNSFLAKMVLSNEAIKDLNWWLSHVQSAKKGLRKDSFDLRITTDASLTGWGAECNGQTTRGFWSILENRYDINELEMIALFNGLKCFSGANKEILCRTDNTTTISYINKYGGCKSIKLHAIAKSIWQWCEERQITIFASYISTKDNFVADALSRESVDEFDFMLNSSNFNLIKNKLGDPNIDLFASNLTRQCDCFVSWKPSPGCEWVDAFTQPWTTYFYAFPPFSLIPRVLNKIRIEKCEGIVVAPYWPTQAWFPLFNDMSISQVIIIPKNKNELFSPYLNRAHPLSYQVTLMAAILSGQH